MTATELDAIRDALRLSGLPRMPPLFDLIWIPGDPALTARLKLLTYHQRVDILTRFRL